MRATSPRVDSALADLAERQDGVVRRSQLAEVGLSSWTVTSRLKAGRWQAVGTLMVVLHNGPLTERQRQWAAVLNSGSLSALCGRTAAGAAGLDRWASSSTEIVVPRGTTVPSIGALDVRVHESRRFSAADVHPTRLPPQTRIERSVIDAAVWEGDPRTACGLLASAVRQRLTTATRLRSELLRAGHVRHRPLLLAVLGDIAGGAQALSEIDFVRLCRRFRLPSPILQEVRRDQGGRRRYVDASLRGIDGRIVRVEVDGAVHLLVDTYWDDMDRGNEMVIEGAVLLRFATVAVRATPERVADQLVRALGLRPQARAA